MGVHANMQRQSCRVRVSSRPPGRGCRHGLGCWCGLGCDSWVWLARRIVSVGLGGIHVTGTNSVAVFCPALGWETSPVFRLHVRRRMQTDRHACVRAYLSALVDRTCGVGIGVGGVRGFFFFIFF